MHFSLLGPVEASQGGRALPLGGPRQRALLARLLVDANRAVAVDRLVEDLWETPPQDEYAALQNQVSRLRKLLGDRLVTKAPGYLMTVEPGELDLDVFRGLVAEAGAASDLAERSRLLREADLLFRGSPLADVDAPFAEGERTALEELRLAAVEGRVDADLERGNHADLVAELNALVRAYPLRERLRGQQILALYRCGRQADALEAYRDARRMLDEELGLEPSPALRDLERAILTHDESLAGETRPLAEAPPAAPGSAPTPPARRAWLVGAAAGIALALAGTAVGLVLATRSSAPPEPVAAKSNATAPKHPVVLRRAHHTKKTRPAAVVVVHRHRTAPHATKPAPQTTQTAVTTIIETTPARPATVARHPSKPKPVKPASTTPSKPARTISDDFSETTPNYTLWNTGGDGNGTSWALQNGALVFTIPADAQPGGQYNQVGPVWGTQCRFDGNFDEQIHYQLLEWPHGSGARVQLNAWVFKTSDWSASARATTSDVESYNGNIGQSWNDIPTTDLQGTLRVARVGTTETAYYKANGKWMAIRSASAPGEAQLGIQLFATAQDWQHQEVSVAFDNFRVTATNFWCP